MYNGSTKKVRWSKSEKEAIYHIFGENIKKKVLPSLKAIQVAVKETPALQNRTSPQIKTWIHNQLKLTKKNLFLFDLHNVPTDTNIRQ